VEKTFVNKGQTELKWVLIDVGGQRLGRIASHIAHVLMAKQANYLWSYDG
jgi:ribosomal protein L13